MIRIIAKIGIALLALGACANDTPPEAKKTHTNAAASDAALLAASCSGCHAAGNSEMLDLSDRSTDSIQSSLNAYKRDTSGQTVMHRLARGYSDEDIQIIANYLSEDEEPAHD